MLSAITIVIIISIVCAVVVLSITIGVIVGVRASSIETSNSEMSGDIGILSVPFGGTGLDSIGLGKVMIGNGTNPIVATKNAPSGDFVGTTDSQTLSNKTLTNATISSLATPLPISSGGTGFGSVTNDTFLTVNGSGAIVSSLAVPAGTLVGTTEVQTLTNKTLTSPIINTPTITGGTISLSSPLGISSGGTGLGLVTNETFLTVNGSGAFETAVALPTGSVVGTTQTQTLTNKTLTSPTIATIINVGTLTLPSSTDTLVGRDTTDTLTNKTLTAPTINGGTINSPTINDATITFASPLPVGSGGTGVASFVGSRFLSSNAGGTAVETLKTIPSGVVVGDTDSQTLTNKTLTSPIISTIVNTGTLTLPTSTDTIVARNTTDTLTNKTLTSPTINGGTISALASPLGIASGGTGLGSVSNGTFLTVNGSGAFVTTVATPVGAVLGTTDTQSLTNKTITDTTNLVTATSLRTATTAVSISGATAPTNGQVLTATSGTNATWQTPSSGASQFSTVWTSTAAKTWATTTEDSFFGTGVGSLTYAIGTISIGLKIWFEIRGYVTCPSSQNLSIKVKIGPTGLQTNVSSAIITPSVNWSNRPFVLRGQYNVLTTGVSGTIQGDYDIRVATTATGSDSLITGGTSAAALDSTVSNDFTVTGKFNTSVGVIMSVTTANVWQATT